MYRKSISNTFRKIQLESKGRNVDESSRIDRPVCIAVSPTYRKSIREAGWVVNVDEIEKGRHREKAKEEGRKYGRIASFCHKPKRLIFHEVGPS